MSRQDAHQATVDAVRGHWVNRIAPEAARPYLHLARADRPIGWWLLLWPCWWSAALAAVAAGQWPNLWHLVLFLVGAIAMRAAGCVWNDIVDRDIDAMVARTSLRPIASGRVSVRQAAAFMAILCLVGLVVLMQFNWFAVGLGFASLAVVAVYPLAKRITWWPQIVLGLAFNWGALMGWAAVFGSLSAAPVLLYLGGIAWTIGYDTIYAHQDKEDDALIGVKSTARLFGPRTRPWLALFYALAVVLFAAALWTADAGIASYVGLAAASAHLAWQTRALDIDDSEVCLRLFRSNRDFGWLLFAGLVIDAGLRAVA